MSKAGHNRPAIDYDGCARVLAEAALFGDKRTSQKHGITTQTIRNYRRRMDLQTPEGERLRKLVMAAKETLTKRWADRLVPAIVKAVDFIEAAVEEAAKDPACLKNPEMLEAVTSSMRLLADTHMGERLLDVRLAREDRDDPATDRPVGASEEAPEEPRH